MHKNYSISDEELNIIAYQYRILGDFLYHYRSYKVLHKNIQKLIGNNEFWVYTINAHLMQCVNYWCMVFGSHKNNHTHWKKLSFVNHEDNFEKRLLIDLGIDSNQWLGIWKKLTDFRNKFTAHRDINFSKPVPHLEYSYKSALIYDRWLNEDIFPNTMGVVNNASLKYFEEDYVNKIDEEMKKLYKVPE